MQLAFETSTDVCSVAYRDAEGNIFSKFSQGRGVHSEQIFFQTSELMSEHNFDLSQINEVLISIGPGSYTGLRIAVSAVKGFFFGQKASFYAVNTLASFASSCLDYEEKLSIHSIIDARRTHAYYQKFEVRKGEISSVEKAQILDLNDIESRLNEGDVMVGTGIERLKADSISKLRVISDFVPSAESLFTLFDADKGNKFCEKVSIEALDSNYVTSSQINNSSS